MTEVSVSTVLDSVDVACSNMSKAVALAERLIEKPGENAEIPALQKALLSIELQMVGIREAMIKLEEQEAHLVIANRRLRRKNSDLQARLSRSDDSSLEESAPSG